MKLYLVILALGVCLFSTGCGSSGPTPPPPTTYSISGTVTGLAGTGLVLQDNGGDNLTVSANATTFTFATAITGGSSYKVTVLTQPSSPAQTCAVTSGSGTASAKITSVVVTCTTTTYTIGGTISGLTGTGLVLQDNAGDNLTVSANATAFTFATALDTGASYKVTVLTQPSGPTQSCVVTNGSGTASANVTNVSLACTTLYTIGGTISGLVGTGLVLQDNGLDNLTVSANATSFTFATPIANGSGYNVTVLAQPSVPTQNCVVTGGTGKAGTATSISIACTTVTYTVGGMVSGLAGTGLVLQDNGGNNLPVSANGSFTFSASVGQGLPYSVTVSTQPSNPVQNCVVTGGSGTVTGPVTTVSIACTTTMYTIGGTVSGLTGTNLVLQDNGGDNLSVLANATSFAFATKLNSLATYNVTVLTQPITPTQDCVITSGGSGTAGPNVNVVVTCTNISEWTWENGPNVDDQLGVYGTIGTANASNVPGARYAGVSWSDSSGNFWLFGGLGYESPVTTGADFNDLWQYSPTTGDWTWVGGADIAGVGGTYGTIGVAAAGNIPGARDSAVSWTDASGNFWLFGGHGYDSAGTADNLNDLWEYATSGPNAGQWTWISGSDTVDQLGVYGTQGTGASGNVPGARFSAVSWIDKSGNFWLFGGRYDVGSGSSLVSYYLNDLWEYSPTTNEWTWQNGLDTTNGNGAYGSEGTGGPGHYPGARYLSVGWTDTQANLWLFGGFGYDAEHPNPAVMSDVWEYNTSAGVWTWVGGPELASYQGTYGTLGMPGSGNIPGSRKGAVAWTDSLGNFWLFGGIGIDSTNTAGELNDLWEYTPNLTNPTLGEWTWESGADVVNQPGNWGTLGVAATTNIPGARGVSANWIDSNGNLWLFGGNGPDSGKNGSFSDLWKFVP